MTEFQQRVLDVIKANPGIFTGAVKAQFPDTTSSAVGRALNTLRHEGYIGHPAWNQTRQWEAR